MTTVEDQASKARTRLLDKVCIVTGAGQGIGKATALRLGAEGARLIVVDWLDETANATAESLREAGVDAAALVADLQVSAEADRVMAEAAARFGRIDALVNVVGGTIWWQRFEDYSEEQILLELERSLHTTLWCCRAVLPYMIRQSGGSIVNFGSAVTRGGLYRTPYAVSKGGIEALTRTLAAENGQHGIRVNGVAPGTTLVPDRVAPRLMIRPGEEAAAAPGTEERIAHMRAQKRVALARASAPEEQAAVAAFLASDDASFITGQMIECNGGLF